MREGRGPESSSYYPIILLGLGISDRINSLEGECGRSNVYPIILFVPTDRTKG